MLIDTHAHLDYTDYDPDRAEVIARATEAGVTEIISIGTRIDSSTRALELAENFPNIWATVGIHPCDIDSAPDDAVERLRALGQSRRVVAIGEIGLDYHRLPENPAEAEANKQRQALLFRQQLELAVELGLNAVIHQRDSWEDTLHILAEFTGKVRGVFHCFGGILEQAREVIAMGHFVSFTGIVTFKNAKQVQETARQIDPRHFMVETDCPYLAPAPDRGKRCEPAHTRRVAEYLAELRGVSLETLANRTTENAREFFKFAR
jgi:TatD DNase family protein